VRGARRPRRGLAGHWLWESAELKPPFAGRSRVATATARGRRAPAPPAPAGSAGPRSRR
jgi:hypothetical protein